MNFLGNLSIVDPRRLCNSPELAGAVASVVTEINGTLYVFVAAQYDDGVQVLKLADNQLETVFSIGDTNALALQGATELRIVESGGEKFLIVLAPGDDGISSFRIDQTPGATEGHLVPAQSLYDGGSLALFADSYLMETVTTSAGAFVITASQSDDALNVLRVEADGQFTFVDSVADSEDADYNLNGAWSVAVHQTGAQTYVYVSGSDDAGLSVFSMSAGGTLTSVQDVELTQYAVIQHMTVVPANGGHYLVVSESDTNRLITYEIGAGGALTFVSQLIYDVSNTQLQFNDFTRLETMVIDGVAFVVGASSSSDAVVVFGLDQNGVLSLTTSLASTALNGVFGLTAFQHAGRQYVLSSARDASSITLLEVGAADDPLVATQGDDQIVGLGGDDDIVARGGNDLVYGGDGDDVVSGRAGDDSLLGGAGQDVLLGGAGNDILQGGTAADILMGNTGVDTLSYSASAAAVTVNLGTGTASGGDASGDVFIGMEALIGSARSDALTGSAGANRIESGAGNDTVLGLQGVDVLYGGDGNDQIYGGDQADRLFGDLGRDTINGDTGNDVLRGGGSNDVIYGGTGNDELFGDAGNDTLVGDAGDDIMDGGGGVDIFRFIPGLGSDQINGFSIAEDILDLSAITGINSLAEFRTAAVSFGGNTVVNLPDDESIFLIGVIETQFTVANFIF